MTEGATIAHRTRKLKLETLVGCGAGMCQVGSPVSWKCLIQLQDAGSLREADPPCTWGQDTFPSVHTHLLACAPASQVSRDFLVPILDFNK